MTRSDYDRVLTRLRRQKGDSTFREYQRHVRQFREWLQSEYGMSVFDAGVLEVEDMVDDMLDDGYSVSSIRVRRAALSEFYRRAVQLSEGDRIDQTITENPLDDLHLSDWQEIRQKAREAEYSGEDDIPYLSPEQVNELADNVPKPYTRNELLVRSAFQTGCRRKELVGIKLSDIQRNTRTVTIRPENSKSGKSRVVGYQPSLNDLLDPWIDNVRPSVAMADESEYLFPSNRSLHISGQQFNDIVKEAADNAGIQSVKMVNKAGEARASVTAHVLRHSFAMAAIANDWNLYVLKDALGHSSVDITEMYLHEDEKRVMENFRNRGPGGTSRTME